MTTSTLVLPVEWLFPNDETARSIDTTRDWNSKKNLNDESTHKTCGRRSYLQIINGLHPLQEILSRPESTKKDLSLSTAELGDKTRELFPTLRRSPLSQRVAQLLLNFLPCFFP